MKRNTLKTGLAVLLCMTFSITLSGRGLDNSGIGIKGFSMAAAFFGIADDASAIFYNPGGLTFLDQNSWNAEIYGYMVNAKFTYSTPLVESKSDEKFPIPGFFISKTFKKLALGIGSYVPFGGGGVDYKNFMGTPYNLKSVLGIFCVSPAISYRLLPKLSLGVGLCMYYGKMDSTFTGIETEYSGTAGYGSNIGLMFQANKHWSLGFSVRTPVSVKMNGSTTMMGLKIDSQVEFKLPGYLSFGIGYKPDPGLTIGFSLVHMSWGDMDKMTFTTMGIPTDFITNYKNSWFAGLGVEYIVSTKLKARTGINYYQSSTKDEGLSPETNDVNFFSTTLGFAYSITKAIELNMTGILSFGVAKEYNFQTFDQDHMVLLAGFRFKF
jgi:long-chain fatty acid transport protein